MKVKLSLLAASALLAMGISGCGGGSDYTTTAVAPSVVGVAVDGYLSGATVCVDMDGNESTCEYTTTTTSTGGYTIPGTYAAGKIIISGGIDLDTNASFQGVLKAPAGSKVASPLTTLLADGMSATQITTILGLPAGTDLTKDFRAEGGFDAEVARAALQVQAIIGQITEAIAAQSSLSDAAIMSAVVAAIQANITTPAQLLDAAALTAVIEDAVAVDPAVTLTSGEVNTLSTAIDDTVTTLDTAVITETTIATVVQNVSDAVLLTVGAYIQGNSVTVGGQSSTFDQHGAFTPVTVSAATAATDMNVSLTLKNKDGITTTAQTIDLGILIDDVNSSRELKAIIKGATIALNDAGKIVVTVPATAKVYVQGTTSTGTTASAVVTNAVSDQLISDAAGNMTLNLSELISRVESKISSTSFANISEVGSYAVSFYIGGIAVGYDDSASGILVLNAPTETLSVTIDATLIPEMTGLKFSGNITVQ